MDNIKILYDKNTLYEKIKQTADKINSSYSTDKILNLICVLKGGVMFLTELAKHLKMPVKMEFVTLSSYGNSKTSTGEIKPHNLNLRKFENENILIVEDIIDTGYTLEFLVNYLKQNSSNSDIKIAVLLDKKCARKVNISPDFNAFEIDNKFIVGFGLDYQGLYRNLDYIGYID